MISAWRLTPHVAFHLLIIAIFISLNTWAEEFIRIY